MDDGCAVCADALEWMAYESCGHGHHEVCPNRAVQLRPDALGDHHKELPPRCRHDAVSLFGLLSLCFRAWSQSSPSREENASLAFDDATLSITKAKHRPLLNTLAAFSAKMGFTR